MNYKELKIKYVLPEYKELDFEFEIDEDAKFILREIRRKINSKVHAYLDIIQGVLQPETSDFTQMYEMNFVSESKKLKLLKFYKKLMKISRWSDEIAMTFNEEQEATFIKKIYSEWTSIKEEMLKLIKTMKESWDKELKQDNDTRYMG